MDRRVALGGVAKVFLRQFGIEILSHTTAIGKTRVPDDFAPTWEQLEAGKELPGPFLDGVCVLPAAGPAATS